MGLEEGQIEKKKLTKEALREYVDRYIRSVYTVRADQKIEPITDDTKITIDAANLDNFVRACCKEFGITKVPYMDDRFTFGELFAELEKSHW